MASVSATAAEHLRTDHLSRNLGQRALSGGVLTATAQAVKFLLNIASAAVLARLLTPNDFGLVGMVLAITGLLRLFEKAGLSTATVQRDRVTQDQVSNLFWINVMLGAAVCLISMCLTPLVARFYQDTRLIGIMSLLSLTFPITSSTVQHQALLTRQMRFRALAIIDLTSMLAGILSGCFLALLGAGYWALVGMQLTVAAVTLALTWRTSGWRPGFPRRGSGVAPLVRFGAHVTAADLVGCLSANSDGILVGRFFGADILGLYTRAHVLFVRPLEQIHMPVGSVVIPVLSRLQSEPERYRRTFLRVYDALALITLPFAALCLVLAEPLVLLLLGPQWSGAVPLFSAFTLLGVSLPLSIVPSWLLMSQGRGRDLLQTYSIAGGITVAAYLAGMRWGPLGMILALAVTSLFIRMPILYHLAGRRGPVTAADLWKGFVSHLPCWAMAYAAASVARASVADAAPLVQLLVCMPAGAIAGIGAAFLIQRPRRHALSAWKMSRAWAMGARCS